MAATISVIVVTFNNASTIEGALNSVLRQAQPPEVEVIVVDNASSDGTAERVAHTYGDRIRVLQNPRNGGFAYGVNRGLEAADGEIAFLLNPDARLVESDLLRGLYMFVMGRPDAGAVSPAILSAEGEWMGWSVIPGLRETFFDNLLSAKMKRRLTPLAGWLKFRPVMTRRPGTMPVETCSGGAMMFRRERVEEVGFWDEAYFMYLEDIDFCYRLQRAGYRIFLAAEYTVEHERRHSSQRLNNRAIWISRRHYLSRRYFFKKYDKHVAAAMLPVLWYASHALKWLALTVSFADSEARAVHAYWMRTLVRGGEKRSNREEEVGQPI